MLNAKKETLSKENHSNFSVFVTPAISNSLGTGEKSFDFKNNIGDYKRGLQQKYILVYRDHTMPKNPKILELIIFKKVMLSRFSSLKV